MSNAIVPPCKTFTLMFSKSEIESKIAYICNELPTYKVISKNEMLKTMRVESHGAFTTQHIDIAFEEIGQTMTNIEIEITKSIGGMTNDDSMLKAKKNMDEFTDYLTKTLSGYQITKSDVKKVKKSKRGTVILYIVAIILLGWFYFGGGLELLFGLSV